MSYFLWLFRVLEVAVFGWVYAFLIHCQQSLTAFEINDPDAVEILAMPGWRIFHAQLTLRDMGHILWQ